MIIPLTLENQLLYKGFSLLRMRFIRTDSQLQSHF
jgi:hypothetical protein